MAPLTGDNVALSTGSRIKPDAFHAILSLQLLASRLLTKSALVDSSNSQSNSSSTVPRISETEDATEDSKLIALTTTSKMVLFLSKTILTRLVMETAWLVK